jgi:hypothetical protein
MFEKKNIITMSIPELQKNKPEKKLRISEITKEMSTKKNLYPPYIHQCHKGAFTNQVDKKRWAVIPKISTFRQCLYGRKCKRRWVVGQKKPKSCQGSL